MTLEEAIKTAIEYEIKVRDTYLNAIDNLSDNMGQRVFKVLGDEEQGHIDYLEKRLQEWVSDGKVTSETLSSVVPSQNIIEQGIQKLDSHVSSNNYGTELESLKKALAMEQETSNFYRRMVDEMGDEGSLFQRFLEIEDGHQLIVQAEIDYLERTGTFFDFQEFTME